MQQALIRKLEGYEELSDQDRWALNGLTTRVRQVGARVDLIHEGDPPENVHLILDGFACRYKMLPNGQRQIMAFLVPGDFCDLHVAILGHMDHTIGTSWGCTVVEIPRATIDELTTHHPRITRALWWATLADEGTLREWLVNMGQRDADRQMAHFLCEMLVRLQVVERASRDSFVFPITQTDLADTLGITPVHANRVLKELRNQGLVTWKSRQVHIPDVGRLMDFADFDPRYLHLTPRAVHA